MSTTPDRAKLSGNPTISMAPNDSSGERYLTDQFSKVPFGVVSRFTPKLCDHQCLPVYLRELNIFTCAKEFTRHFRDFLVVVPQMDVEDCMQSTFFATFKWWTNAVDLKKRSNVMTWWSSEQPQQTAWPPKMSGLRIFSLFNLQAVQVDLRLDPTWSHFKQLWPIDDLPGWPAVSWRCGWAYREGEWSLARKSLHINVPALLRLKKGYDKVKNYWSEAPPQSILAWSKPNLDNCQKLSKWNEKHHSPTVSTRVRLEVMNVGHHLTRFIHYRD